MESRMARPLVFTQAVIRQIPPLVRNGASVDEIAHRIGCTVGSLRVRCSQLGISLKRPGRRSALCNQALNTPSDTTSTRPELACFRVTLNPPLLSEFEDSARARGLSSTALAQALLEVIVQDGLYEAVLDGGAHA